MGSTSWTYRGYIPDPGVNAIEVLRVGPYMWIMSESISNERSGYWVRRRQLRVKCVFWKENFTFDTANPRFPCGIFGRRISPMAVDAFDICRVAACPAMGAAGAVVGIAIELIPDQGRIRSFYRVNIVTFFKPVVCQFLKVAKVNNTVAVEISFQFVLFETSGPIESDVIEEYGAGIPRFGCASTKTY